MEQLLKRSGGGEEGSKLWAAKVLILSIRSVKGSRESRAYALLLYIYVTSFDGNG